MNPKLLSKKLDELVENKVAVVKEAGTALVVEVAQEPGAQTRSIILFPDWLATMPDGSQLSSAQFGLYEHNFKTKLDWESYKKQARECRAQLEELKGFEAKTFKLSGSDNSLEIRFTDGASIVCHPATTDFSRPNWILIDPTENLTCSVFREYVEARHSEVGLVMASRDFTLRKSGKDFKATLHIGVPQLKTSGGNERDEFCCGFEIESELGGVHGSIFSEESLSALLLTLRSAQGAIDKLAAKHSAEAFYVGEDLSPVHKFRDEFATLHGLMDRLYSEKEFDENFVASPEGINCLKQMKEVLQLLKEFRADQKS